MKYLFYFFVLLGLFTSCATSNKQKGVVYIWEGKVIAKKEYYRELSNFNDVFIRKYKPLYQ